MHARLRIQPSSAVFKRVLTFQGGADPSWSPHASKIAFTRKHDLYVIDSRGGRSRRLTRKGGDWPAWSPDGRQIAFIRWKPQRHNGVAYLYALDVRHVSARQLRDREVPWDRWFSSPPEWQALPRR